MRDSFNDYDDYTQAADDYIQQIREHSPAAAASLDQIREKFGVRAAYLAAFALVVLKQKLRPAPDALKKFTFYQEMQDNAEAIRLYNDAAAKLLSP